MSSSTEITKTEGEGADLEQANGQTGLPVKLSRSQGSLLRMLPNQSNKVASDLAYRKGHQGYGSISGRDVS